VLLLSTPYNHNMVNQAINQEENPFFTYQAENRHFPKGKTPSKKSLFLSLNLKNSPVINDTIENRYSVYRYIYSLLYSNKTLSLYYTYFLSVVANNYLKIKITTKKLNLFELGNKKNEYIFEFDNKRGMKIMGDKRNELIICKNDINKGRSPRMLKNV